MSLHFANYFILKQSKICFIIVEKLQNKSKSEKDHIANMTMAYKGIEL